MPRPSPCSLPLYFLINLLLLQFSRAQVSMQKIQLVASFPPSCIEAYSTILPSCTEDMFRGVGGTSQCTQDCFNELTALSRIVQTACAGRTASRDTVIGHLFFGDADRWLCGFETAPAGTTAAETISAATTEAATSTDAASTTAPAEETSSSTSTISSTPAAVTTESDAETSTTEASLTTTTLETATTSTTSSTESTSTTTAIATAAGSSNDEQVGITGGGSPFDIALPARGVASSSDVSKVGLVLAALVGITATML